MKGTLDKLGVEPIKVARKEYKTAANSFAEEGFTEPHRESTQALMDSILSVLPDGIASGREMKKDDARAAFDKAIMTKEAMCRFVRSQRLLRSFNSALSRAFNFSPGVASVAVMARVPWDGCAVRT